jgi:hypothetical protein
MASDEQIPDPNLALSTRHGHTDADKQQETADMDAHRWMNS